MKGWSYYLPKGRKYWRICGPRINGKPVTIQKRWDGKALYSGQDANDTLDLIAHQLEDGTFNIRHWGKDRTIEIERAWAVYQEQVPVKKVTEEDRDRIFKDFILPFFEGKLLTAIDQEDIWGWWTTIPKTYKPSYLRLIRARLRAFFDFHPITYKKRFKYPKVVVPHKDPEFLTREQQDKRFAFIPIHDQPIFRFLQAYGCRVSEACNLRRGDLDWEKNEITFRERKNDKENTIRLFDDVKVIIKAGTVTHLEYVFCMASGEKYSRQRLNRIWTDTCKRGKFKPIPLKNATRTSLVCQWLNQGVPPVKVARMVGDTVDTILKYYAAITLDGIEEAHRASLQR